MAVPVRTASDTRPSGGRRSRPLLAIVGGGASGTLTAAHLLRAGRGAWRVVVIDRASHGPGVAYSTRDPRHLLNVSACGMSAFDDDPDDLLRWCHARGYLAGDNDYLQRRLYGAYLRDLLVRYNQPGDLELLLGDVTTISRADERDDLRLALQDGRELVADAVVLAIGNFPPGSIPGVQPGPRVIDDPWNPDSLGRVGGAERVVVVGSGLTAIDITLTLAGASPMTEVLAISRHGELPRAHTITKPERIAPPLTLDSNQLQLSHLITAVRAAVRAQPAQWRSVIDSLRPLTPSLWQALSLDDQRTFLREVRWQWDLHRHRMAPAVAREIDGLRATGRLQLQAGTLTAATTTATTITASIEHDGQHYQVSADWLINATGLQANITAVADPLVRLLLAAGVATPDAHNIGFACDSDGALRDRTGRADPRLLTLGPLRRGELFESIAVPEIRTQAARISDVLMATERRLTAKRLTAP